MGVEESEIICHKELANRNIADFSPAVEKLNKICYKIALKIDEYDKKAATSDDVREVGKYSKLSSLERENLLKVLPLKYKIETIVKKNAKRKQYFEGILSNLGIYNDKTDPKQIDACEKENLKSLSSEDLGLDRGDVKLKYFGGVLLEFDENGLNWASEKNKEVLLGADEKLLHEIVEKFSESVKTVSSDMLLNTKFKVRLLKEITGFVFDRMNNFSIKQINEKLGNLLRFKTQITDSLDSFVAGVQNLFDVMVLDYLIDCYPERREEFEQNLKCNTESELLPLEILQRHRAEKQQVQESLDDESDSSEEVGSEESDDYEGENEGESGEENGEDDGEAEVNIELDDESGNFDVDALGDISSDASEGESDASEQDILSIIDLLDGEDVGDDGDL